MSIPEEPAVAYSGKALLDLFMILTWINDMRTKISDKAQGARLGENSDDLAAGNKQLAISVRLPRHTNSVTF
jgi:hypothetical protein